MKSLLLMGILAAGGSAFAAELKVALPLGRTVYQTNERIDFVVTRPAAAAGELKLTLTDAAGSVAAFTFPTARAVEHLHVNGALLKPGKYAVEVADGATTAKTEIEVFSHIRRSSYKIINWGTAKAGEERLKQGEGGFGYNFFYTQEGKDGNGDFIRAGLDWMSVCTMSGAHQMDLRMECDWSDPYVTRGGTQRVAQRAFQNRSCGNVPGVHFYDEPGLTWWKNPAGEFGPHGVPAQTRSFEAAFDKTWDSVPWADWARWKLGFMDAAWKEAQFGVSYVRPDLLSLTQSQYGWSAFTDEIGRAHV